MAGSYRLHYWNGADWTQWSPGPAADLVYASAIFNGQLVVGGAPGPVFRWTGTQWQLLGNGLLGANGGPAYAYALHVHNNELIVGGTFQRTAGPNSITLNNIARWNGSAWQAVGSTGGSSPGAVYALGTLDGHLYAGGSFNSIGSTSVTNIGRWNGASWQPLDAGCNGTVWSIQTYGGLLHVGGQFSTAGGQPAAGLATWSGTNWATMNPSPLPGSRIYAMHEREGRLYVGGQCHFPGISSPNVAAWNGAEWLAVGSGTDGAVGAFADHEEWLVIGGTFEVADGRARTGTWLWNGETGPALGGQGFSKDVTGLSSFGGRLYVGGRFRTVGDHITNRVAYWDSTWHPMNPDLTGGSGYVRAFVEFESQVLAAGNFSSLGGVDARNIARWDGQAWHPLGPPYSGLSGLDGRALAVYNGMLVVGGDFDSVTTNLPQGIPAENVAQWDGATWSVLGPGLNDAVSALCVKDGRLYAGGQFTAAGAQPVNGIAAWDGQAWSALGSGIESGARVAALIEFEGDLVAAGSFQSIGGTQALRVARWDGTQWSALGAGFGTSLGTEVRALAVYNGRLYAGGALQGDDLKRWNGTTWENVGVPGPVEALAVYQGRLAIGGNFDNVAGLPSSYFAFWSDGQDCYANCDCSAVTPVLNVADFTCFLQRFAAGDSFANCDNSTTPPVLNVADFTCFLQAFAGGCP